MCFSFFCCFLSNAFEEPADSVDVLERRVCSTLFGEEIGIELIVAILCKEFEDELEPVDDVIEDERGIESEEWPQQ